MSQPKPVSKMFKAQIVQIRHGDNEGRWGWVVCTPDTLYRSGKNFSTRNLAAFDAVHEHKLTGGVACTTQRGNAPLCWLNRQR